jgi:ketosteroid isomerase-like protein
VATTRAALTKRDREFSKASAAHGTSEAFLSYSADDVRLFRDDHFPFAGKGAILEALRPNKGVMTWQPTASDVSRSGDLGYTYGLYELRSNDAAKTLTGKGNYMRVWKKQQGTWRVVLDVANPLPLPSTPDEKEN